MTVPTFLLRSAGSTYTTLYVTAIAGPGDIFGFHARIIFSHDRRLR